MANDERATRPEDLTRLFLERANAGDVAGVAELYAPDAVHALPDGSTVVGREAIRDLFTRILADQPTFTGQQLPVLSDGELAITSTRWPRTSSRWRWPAGSATVPGCGCSTSPTSWVSRWS